MTQSVAPPDATVAAPRQPSDFRAPFSLFFTCLLLVVASVAWRKGTYFSGGADPVVLSKATLTLLGVAIAWLAPRPAGTWSRFRAAPVLWLGAYLIISVVGGIINGDGFSSVVLAVRLSLLATALLLLTVSHSWQAVLTALTAAMVVLAAVGGVTGASSVAEKGRLYGGIPPLNANEICLLVSVMVVLLCWRLLHGQGSRLACLALLPLLGVAWLTGSRSGLAALVVAVLLVVVMARLVPTSVMAGLLFAVPVVLYLTFFTPLLADFAGRGDLASVTTLNSRTTAWTAALNYADTAAEKIFGSGLALKEIPVSAMYRTEQILDSTWISALIQAGYLGATMLVLFVLTTLRKAFRMPGPERSLVFALTAMVTIVSVLESGLFDTTPAFIVFFTMAVLANRVAEPSFDAKLGLEPAHPGKSPRTLSA